MALNYDFDYSQEGEQEIIFTYFREKGEGTRKFLDIGAYDGIKFSNVYALILNGWDGVSIEASPFNFVALANNYKQYPNIVFIQALIDTSRKGLQVFYDCDAISSTSLEHINQWDNQVTRKIHLPTITLEDVASHVQSYFDFVNLDIEGYSIELLQDVFKYFNPSLVCVEYDNKLLDCIEIAENNGYKKIFSNGINAIFCKK